MGKRGKPLQPFKDHIAEEKHGKGGITQYFKKVKKKKEQKKKGRPKKKKKGGGRPKNDAPSNDDVTKDSSRVPIGLRKSPIETDKNKSVEADTNTNNGGCKSSALDTGDKKKNNNNNKDGAPGKKKATRINWGVSPHREVMERAIDHWLNDKEDRYDENGERIDDYAIFANRKNIPPSTFYKYIQPDLDRRKVLGNGNRGKKKVLNDDDINLLGCVMARCDRGNDGLSRKESTDLIIEINPNLNRAAASRQLSRRIIPICSGKGIIKNKLQKVQATTSDRTNINTAQQYRWHRIVTEEYSFLRENNMGLCKKSGLSFGEVIGHFIIGLDEMCLMSDQHGGLHIIGAADKKKHEKLLQDSRVSITIVRTGTVWGTNGPTIFLLSGVKRRPAWTDELLEKHGMAKGSTIIMTENAFMTNDAWVEVSKAIVMGYRNLPYIRENDDWHVLELLDGFGSHEHVLESHELRAANKIRSLKEESSTSHANQGYDQETARRDKQKAAESLYDQRKMAKITTGKTHIDQYDLVLCGIRIVRGCEPQTWVVSFQRVNLDPRTRVCFQEWCKKISHFLCAGEAFKEESIDPTPRELFQLLPPTWHGMSVAERKVVMTIVTTNGGYTRQCLEQLHNECRIPYSQMNDIRVCVIIGRDHPETLEMELTNNDTSKNDTNDEVEAARAATAKQSDGLDAFQLIPKDSEGNSKLSGDELLEHMCRYRNEQNSKALGDGSLMRLQPSAGLDLDINEESIRMIQPTMADLVRGAIIRDACGANAKRKCAKRKLTNIGTIVGQSAVVNSDENMKRMRESLEFSETVANIRRLEADAQEKKKVESIQELLDKAPEAARKIEGCGRNLESRAATVEFIKAILFKVYSISMSGSKLKKVDYAKALKKEFERDIGKYESYVASLENNNNEETAPPAPTSPPTEEDVPAEEEIDNVPVGQVEEVEPIEEAEEELELMDEAEEEVEVEVEAMAEEATAATLPASNICENRSAQWLYNHCNQLRTAIGTNKSTIDLANIAVKALMKIKDENKEQVCTKITYLTIIRNAFRARAIGGSVTDAFINGLADKCDELIDDENEDELNECELNKIVSM